MINRVPLQQADGALSYLEFIAAVKKVWEEGHPNIPLVPKQTQAFAAYPVITYNLDIRRPHHDEPKRKMREQYTPTGKKEVRTIYGQRFINVVRFTAVDLNPVVSEQIIEAFEEFMIEYTPAFKLAGASELTYGRRYQDNDENQPGQDASTRSVAYQVTTEKLFETSDTTIQRIVLDIRTFLDNNVIDADDLTNSATPVLVNIIDLYESATPATPVD